MNSRGPKSNQIPRINTNRFKTAHKEDSREEFIWSAYYTYIMLRVIFNWVSNIIHVCFGFSLIRVVIGSRTSYFLDKRIKTKTNSESLTHFARPTVFVIFFWMIHWIACFHVIHLPVITLVLEWRHSNKNHPL